MRFRLIDANKAAIPIDRMCGLLGVSVSGFYAWKDRGPSQRQLDDMVLLAHIRSQFASSHETYGVPRMHVELREDGVSVGRHRVARLMRDNGLKALKKRRYKGTIRNFVREAMMMERGESSHGYREGTFGPTACRPRTE